MRRVTLQLRLSDIFVLRDKKHCASTLILSFVLSTQYLDLISCTNIILDYPNSEHFAILLKFIY